MKTQATYVRSLCTSSTVFLVLETSSEINFESVKFAKKNVKLPPLTKTNRESYQIFGNLQFITNFDNFLSFVKPDRPISTLFLPFLDQ